MAYISFQFFVHTFMVMHLLFKADGIGLRRELGLWAGGIRWMFGRGGVFWSMRRHYLAYYRPSFDPWQDGDLTEYRRWRSIYERSDDALSAARAVIWPDRAVAADVAPAATAA